ncbi:MAG TPA: glycosyltransferase family 1 protein [Anaerolineae bacterium]|nr:glycosyltransferase family 1 protein [Anaerolineae bacterium]HIQ05522.1 glycosyltransferase family 1 protein [Anaerolineae bacterium]
MPPVRVVMLVYEPGFSGQSRHVLSLAGGIDRSRYDVTVVYPMHLTRLGQRLASLQVKTMPLPLRKWWNPDGAFHLWQLLRVQRPHLLHVHGQFAGLWGRVVGRLAGVPHVVYTPHTVELRTHWLEPIYLTFERLLARWTNQVIAVCEQQRQTLIRLRIAAPDRTTTVYNGVRLPLDDRDERHTNRNALRQSLGLPLDARVVLSVGRLDAQKDPLTLLRAARQVVEAVPSAVFLLAGEGPLQADVLAEQERLGLQERFRLLGWRDDVPALLAASDLFCLSSRWEGMPYALLEALAAGVPIVATDVGGCREAIGQEGQAAGRLVPPADPDALAAAMIALLQDDTALDRLRRRGPARIAAYFTLERMLKDTQTVYESCLVREEMV